MGSLRSLKTENKLRERDEKRIAEYACRTCPDSRVCVHLSNYGLCKRQKELIAYQEKIPGYRYGIVKKS